jgi:hypothetical protein
MSIEENDNMSKTQLLSGVYKVIGSPRSIQIQQIEEKPDLHTGKS